MSRVRYFMLTRDAESRRWIKREFPTLAALNFEVDKFTKWNSVAESTGMPERCVDFKTMMMLDNSL